MIPVSKPIGRHLSFAIAAAFLTCTAAAQDMSAEIVVGGGLPSVVKVDGRFLPSARRADKKAFFLNDEAADISGLAGRVSNIRLFANGESIAFRRLSAGAFLAEREFDSWKYEVKVNDGKGIAGLAHISRLDGSAGVLMLDDLLPAAGDKVAATVRFALPEGWAVLSTEKAKGDGTFEVPNAGKSVFVIGKGWRIKEMPGGVPKTAIRGEWLFSDDELADFTTEVFDHYAKIFGGFPAGEKLVAIAPFPSRNGFGSWEADTRGRTVNILLSDAAFATQSKQRLHEILRHELFHLWLPNGVNLPGNYRWFYEGAALYASLKAAVMLNRIRFDDMLSTLSNAIQIETAAPEQMSLIELSQHARAENGPRLYARGLIASFLSDVEMLAASGGRRSFERLLRDIYRKHCEGDGFGDATEAVLAAMRLYPELQPIISGPITGRERSNWQATIAKAGLEYTNGRLQVNRRLNGAQKARLDDLGYNAWRKSERIRQ